ncbi:hypothetical protein PA598K_04829 [Paenibacillus sp. 598K]|nr:hypothetical protein PA598K_04829 [Paenibacillus sp. 598K]
MIQMHKLVSLSFLLVILLLANGCSSEANVKDPEPSKYTSDSFTLQSIQSKKASVSEGEDHYEGIQYDLILTTENISEEELAAIGVKLNFTGATSEILGQQGAGYTTGFTLLDRQGDQKKLLTTFMVIQSPPIAQDDLDYLLSPDSAHDLSATIYDNNTPIATTSVN